MYSRREFLRTSGSLAGAALFAGAQKNAPRPNIIFVLVDDLRFDELGCTGHPFASTPNADRLAREGALFSNAFATTPLCSPSRACFLTGRYAHSHGITDNTNRSADSHKLITWPRLLHDAGYDTAFIGKWHMGNDDSPRPGFDLWASFRGQGESVNPEMNINGKNVQARGYITDILTDHAVEFIERRRNNPFCLYLPHKAIHPNVQQRDDGSVPPGGIGDGQQFIAAERHRSLYAGQKIPRRPNYAKVPTDKPALARRLDGVPPLGPDTVTDDVTILNRMRMMKAVDEGLGRILESLERTRTLDNTIVVLTSDHGYFYGEHCLGPERRLAYEETIRIPLLVRYPRLLKPDTRIERNALSVDIAATMLQLAGVPLTSNLHGRPLVGSPMPNRDALLFEYYSDTVFPRVRNMGYQAARTRDWKYIRYAELPGADELYNLQKDPYELENLAGSRTSRNRVEAMRSQIAVLLKQTP